MPSDIPRSVRLVFFLRRVTRPMRAALRFAARIAVLPVDLVFLFFDLFSVNLRKTPLFRTDCRGELGRTGGVICPVCRKYTNRWLISLVCGHAQRKEAVRDRVCRAGETPRIFLMRGLLVLVLYGAACSGAAWAAWRYWPRTGSGPVDPGMAARVTAERMAAADAAFGTGESEVALKLYRDVLAISPGNRLAAWRAGQAAEAIGDGGAALALYDSASAEPDPYPAAVRRVAVLSHQRGLLHLAGKYARRAIQAEIADGETRAVLADWRLWTGDMAGAETLLKAAEQQSPDSNVVRLVRVHALLNAGRTDEAEKALADLEKAGFKGVLVESARLQLLARKGKGAEALRALKTLAKAHPDLGWLWLQMVGAQFRAGDRAGALLSIKELEDSGQVTPGGYLMLAQILDRNGLGSRAIVLAEKAVPDRDVGPDARALIGSIYVNKGLPHIAMRYAEQALALRAEDPTAHVVAGRAATALGDLETAVVHFMAAVRAAPESAWANHFLGMAYARQTRYDEAVKSLAEACRLAPKSGTMQADLGLTLMRAGRLKDARDTLRKAAEMPGSDYRVFTALGIIALKQKDPDAAKAFYAEAVRRSPRQAVAAANNLACLLMTESKDLPRALSLAWTAYLNAPTPAFRVEAADTVTTVLIRSGQAARAVEQARVAVRARPPRADRYLRLATAEDAAGHREQAVAALRRVIAIAKDSPQAETARKRLAELEKPR